MENLILRQLKDQLPWGYAKLVENRAKENNLEISAKQVYDAVNSGHKQNADAIQKIMELLIKDRKKNIEKIV